MIRGLAFWLLAVAPLYAQLQVVIVDPTGERPLTGVTDLGSASMGDLLETRFRARNPGPAAVALQTLAVNGTAFSLSLKPVLPYIVAPGNFAEFRVQFAPLATGSYSASLSVNGAAAIIRASAVAAPVLSVRYAALATVLTPGAAIDFGRVQKNRSATLGIHMANASDADLTVNNVGVSGTAFHGPADLALPVKLRPGEAADFSLSFDPKTSGQQTGFLSIDARQLPLIGVGYDPPIPPASISVSGALTSGSQPRMAVTLADASETAGTGIVTLDFQPATPATPDDPAIVFLATGSRRLSFTVSEGDSAGSFGSQKDVAFQTGTTAGTITLTLQMTDYQVKRTITIAPAAMSIDGTRGTRRVSDLDVTVTGFDNTRTAGRFNFTFYDKAGNVIPPGPIPLDATGDFGRYFAISRVGGAFLMRATFPVAGDATQIGGVEVDLVNSVGTVRTQRVVFP